MKKFVGILMLVLPVAIAIFFFVRLMVRTSGWLVTAEYLGVALIFNLWVYVAMGLIISED